MGRLKWVGDGLWLGEGWADLGFCGKGDHRAPGGGWRIGEPRRREEKEENEFDSCTTDVS